MGSAPKRRERTATEATPRAAPSRAGSRAARSSPAPLRHPLVTLGRKAGAQAKPRTVSTGDAFEREAESVAERVMLMPDTTVRLQRKCGCGECGECAGGPPNVQLRAAAGSEPRDAQPAVDYALNSGGRPLDAETLSFMETRFGHDFGGVRVHTGERAAESARSLGARAYTVGGDVVFGSGQYAPGTDAGRRLIAHELTHVVQQGHAAESFGGGVSLSPAQPQRKVLQRAPSPVAGVSLDWTGPEWKALNKLGVVRAAKTGEVKGAYLRPSPDTAAHVTARAVLMDENTRLIVVATNPTSKWHYVHVLAGQYQGLYGYVSAALVWTGLPDPLAVTYWVEKSGIGLQKIVENHPQYAGYNITTGDDARSLVMAVLVANMEDSRTKDNVYINQEKLTEAKDPGLLGEVADYADEYRRVLRPILQSVEVKRHVRIWLPGPSYIRMMRDRNIIPTRPDWKNTAVKVVKGVGGFLSGLVEGFVTSIIDVFRGIYDLIKSIISTIGDLLSGELIQQAQEIYDKVVEMAANMTAEDFLKMIIGAVTAVVSEIFNDFMRRWDASNHYDKWHFRGYVVGYIVAEVVLAIFTGGTTLAVKLLGKLGKVGALLMKVFRKVLGKVDDMFDAVPGRKARRMGGKHDRDRDADAATEKAKQLPLALALSTALAETHDKADVPVTLALSSLKIAIKPQFGWIKDFEAVPLGPGRYQIYMIASRHPVGDEYTTVNPPQGEAGKPSRPESGAEMEERLLEGAVSPPSATYFGWKSGTGGGTFRGLAKELVKYAKKYKTAVATPGSSVLGEATLKFIQRKPGLKKWWDAELKGITDRMTVLRAEIRKAKGDHATLRKLRAEEQQLDEKLGGLLDWAKKPVGNKKPDLVEVFPNKKVIEVTDITQRPFDPAHNFKTEFYVEVLKELTGWTDVRGLEFARPTVVVPVK